MLKVATSKFQELHLQGLPGTGIKQMRYVHSVVQHYISVTLHFPVVCSPCPFPFFSQWSTVCE